MTRTNSHRKRGNLSLEMWGAIILVLAITIIVMWAFMGMKNVFK